MNGHTLSTCPKSPGLGSRPIWPCMRINDTEDEWLSEWIDLLLWFENKLLYNESLTLLLFLFYIRKYTSMLINLRIKSVIRTILPNIKICNLLNQQSWNFFQWNLQAYSLPSKFYWKYWLSMSVWRISHYVCFCKNVRSKCNQFISKGSNIMYIGKHVHKHNLEMYHLHTGNKCKSC